MFYFFYSAIQNSDRFVKNKSEEEIKKEWTAKRRGFVGEYKDKKKMYEKRLKSINKDPVKKPNKKGGKKN